MRVMGLQRDIGFATFERCGPIDCATMGTLPNEEVRGASVEKIAVFAGHGPRSYHGASGKRRG